MTPLTGLPPRGIVERQNDIDDQSDSIENLSTRSDQAQFLGRLRPEAANRLVTLLQSNAGNLMGGSEP